MKSDNEISLDVTVPTNIKAQLKLERIEQMLVDLDATYQVELHKLAQVSVNFKKKVEESKTKVKDSYFQSKLEKNNQKIYDALVQYNQSKELLLKHKEQALQEMNNANSQEV